ncbi:class I SAM-dependent methyltransferase [Candidatus Micrarchaeota archaeon]|nr:class I SAM-dependent methyltransferase [Candidatus Micrarchaeota archaeon]MBU1166099.1 class I SAM-dependent methyltransferase [Candidatus Micrarchaeota archaeon]MBU1886096.1 class I SAM-dependent methyltransferase [Candidatus Micrarchaeota archaeon]
MKHFTQRQGGLNVLGPGYWNKFYNDAKGKSAWGNPTRLMLGWIQTAKPEGVNRVLDLGGGDGRYAIYFAANGSHVDIVDSSKAAVKALIRLSEEKGATSTDVAGQKRLGFPNGGMIDPYAMDVMSYFSGSEGVEVTMFDLILSSGLLEYLTPNEVKYLITKLQTATKPGGMNLIIYLAQGEEVSDIPGEHPHVAGSVENLYGDEWKMIETTDTTRPDTHIIMHYNGTVSDAPETHSHRIIRFIAIKNEELPASD